MTKKETPQATQEAEADPQKSDVKMLVVAAAVLTLVAAPTGWFLGRYLTGSEHAAAQDTTIHQDDGGAENIKDNKHIIVLSPIVTDMSPLEGGRVRLEISLVRDDVDPLETDLVADIANDFVALLRQITASQIKGASGFMYLREDLLERARIRSQNRISNILISSLVIEQS